MRYICTTATLLKAVKEAIVDELCASEADGVLIPLSFDELAARLRERVALPASEITPTDGPPTSTSPAVSVPTLPTGLIQAAIERLETEGTLICVEGG